jgi:hypothetical protein
LPYRLPRLVEEEAQGLEDSVEMVSAGDEHQRQWTCECEREQEVQE